MGPKHTGSMSKIDRNQPVTDGEWHNVTLNVKGEKVILTLDDEQSSQNSFGKPAHNFFSVKTKQLSFGGSNDIQFHDGIKLTNFKGCFGKVLLNGKLLSFNSWNSVFQMKTTASRPSEGCEGSQVCASNPCTDPLASYCVDTWEAYKCVPPGKCISNPCRYGGQCIPVGTSSFSCKCQANYTGQTCETPTECLLNPCKTDQVCVADIKGFKCQLATKGVQQGLKASTIAVIVVFSTVGLAILIGCLAAFRRRQLRKMNALEANFIDGLSTNYEPGEDVILENFGTPYNSKEDIKGIVNTVNREQTSPHSTPRRKCSLDFELQLLSKKSPGNTSRSQPLHHTSPRPRSEADQHKGSNKSLPLPLYVANDVDRDYRMAIEESRISNVGSRRMLEDLQAFRSTQKLVDSEVNEGGRTPGQLRKAAKARSHESMTAASHNSLGKPARVIMNQEALRQEQTTPPFESGFESTGSDIDSSIDHRGRFGVDDSSTQLEHYDLEVASIGFSEMSWQNDNNSNSNRESKRSNLEKDLRQFTSERLRLLAPPESFFDFASSVSDGQDRSDIGDRLSDLLEVNDSSSDSDGSFTCSEFEYGDDRIIPDRPSRKFIFSKLQGAAETSDSDIDPRFGRLRGFSGRSDFTEMSDLPRRQKRRTKFTRPKHSPYLPPINWDELLNWAMKYENIAEVYRDLGGLLSGVDSKSTVTHSTSRPASTSSRLDELQGSGIEKYV